MLPGVGNGKAGDNFHSVRDVSLHHPGRGKGGKNESADVPPDDVIEEIDAQELNRVFVKRCSLTDFLNLIPLAI